MPTPFAVTPADEAYLQAHQALIERAVATVFGRLLEAKPADPLAFLIAELEKAKLK